MGVFPSQLEDLFTCGNLPHTRGGVSGSIRPDTFKRVSSPHPWGCFLLFPSHSAVFYIFPTPVGVFPGFGLWSRSSAGSSPHPWGCFSVIVPGTLCDPIFPTPVGVFPRPQVQSKVRRYLPHTRGGVSTHILQVCRYCVSSPHPWGCFLFPAANLLEIQIFPTPVGVFPVSQVSLGRFGDLPHTRGGVSRMKEMILLAFESSPHPWGCFCLGPLVIDS